MILNTYRMEHLNWFYFISIASIIIYSQRIQCELTKCCPDNEILALEMADYFCTENETNWDAYNIAAAQMPTCEHKIINVFKSEKYLESNGCIDKNSNDEFVTISCSDDPKTRVHLMNKCCEIGKSYDHMQRSCIENHNTHGHFKNIFKNSLVVFQTAVPNCSDDEVFVEYHSTVNDIKFLANEVIVNDNVLSPEKMCIEDLVNVDPSETRANEQHIIVRSCQPNSICSGIPCIRRCCKADQILKRPRRCEPHPNNTNLIPIFYELTFPIDSNTQTKAYLKEYGVMHSWDCKQIYPLNPNTEDDLHYLHKDGKIYVIDIPEPYDQNNYCIENIINTSDGSIQAHTFLCMDSDEYVQPTKFLYYPYGLSISCVFLALTLIVYLLVPKLLNLHGNTLVSYLTTFLAAYITLAILQFNTFGIYAGSTACSGMAFFLLYTLIATFCWQTVMCFDIWRAFGSLRSSFAMRQNKNHLRQFLYYSAYAWIMPLVWVLFTWYAKNYKPFSQKNWNPSIGETSCFFSDDINWEAHLIFFILPSGIHVIVNCGLFIITAINCSRIKSEIHRMQCISDESNTSTKRKKFLMSRAIFMMNLRLFTVMGISWILEFITTFCKNPIVEFIFDTYNILLGVFIFIIFVFKRKVLYELKCRFGFHPTNMGTATPRSTTVTNTANISMRDIRSTSEKSLPLLTASSTMLQVPNVRI